MASGKRHVALLGLLAGLGAGQAALADEPAGERRDALIHMVRQDCGSCHGLTLCGGLGPALLPETLAGKPVDGLVATILAGRPGTAMPPWRAFLDEGEARWIVERLQRGFPPVANRSR